MVDAVLMGYYGAQNLGDDLMLQCLRRVIERHGCSLTILAENAQLVASQYGLPVEQNYPLLGQFAIRPAILQGKAFRLVRRLLSADLIFAGGGDIFRDSLGLPAFSYQMEKVVLALLARKPVVLINVGISEPTTTLGRFLLQWVLPRCRLIVVRDQRSVDLCRRMGVAASTVSLPDIVLSVRELFGPELAKTPPPAPGQRPAILIALRHQANVYGCFDLNATRIANFAEALDGVVEQHGVDVHFLPCQKTSGEDDHAIHCEIRKRMKHVKAAHLLEWTADIPKLGATFAAARAVIAMRLHAGVLGVAFQKPTMLLPYDAKVAEFGAYADVRHSLLDKDLDSIPQISAALDALLSDTSPTGPPEASKSWCGPVLQPVVTTLNNSPH